MSSPFKLITPMNTEAITKKHEGKAVRLVAAYKAYDAPPHRPTPPTMERKITEVVVTQNGPDTFSTSEPAWDGRDIRRWCGAWRVAV
jgi:hypothetical protein